MKIIIIGPVYPYRGGIAHYTAMLSEALTKAGDQPIVISFRRQYPSWMYPGITDKELGEAPLTVPTELILDPLIPPTWSSTANHIEQYRPDLVIIQWWTTFWAIPNSYLSWRLNRYKIPVVYIIHNVFPHEYHHWDMWLTKIALRNGNAFIVQNRYEKERLERLIPLARTELVPLPIYDKLVKNKIDKAEARKQLGLSENNPIILTFGIVRPYKGLKTLIEAFALLRREGSNCQLLIVGEFWDNKSEYLQQIDRLKVAESIRIEDRYIPNDEIGIWFSAADLFSAAYTGGTQSAAVSLAIGFNLPVIITERIAAGISDNYAKYVTIVPSGDALKLAKALQDQINNRDNQVEYQIPDIPDGWSELVQVIKRVAISI